MPQVFCLTQDSYFTFALRALSFPSTLEKIVHQPQTGTSTHSDRVCRRRYGKPATLSFHDSHSLT